MNQSDDQRAELLSAHFDGELSDEEKSSVKQTLEEWSGGALTLKAYRQVHEQLQQLPRRQLGADFADRVVAEINQNQQSTPVAKPVWDRKKLAGLVAAACVCLAIIIVSLLPPETDGTDNLAGTNPDHGDAPKMGGPANSNTDENKTDGKTNKSDEVDEDDVNKKLQAFVGAAQKDRYQFVIEIVLQPGADEKLIQRCLQQCGVRLDAEDSIAVEGSLEDALMRSEFLADRVVKDPTEDQRDDAELIFMVGGASQITQTWQFLRDNRKLLKPRLNLVRVASANMFAELRKAGQEKWGVALAEKDKLQKGINRAGRLIWNIAILSSAGRGMATQAAVRAEAEPPKPSGSSSGSPARRPGNPNFKALGDKAQFEVLFIIHRN